MKTLHQSLIDYNLALLKAIADSRAVTLATASKSRAIEALSESLLSPTETAIMLKSLSAEEKAALAGLLANGGQLEGPRFMRQYGLIRAMGAARLERERPWLKPANPAESLWYKGLIFKAFQLSSQGNLEIIFIPTDMLPLLKTAFEAEEDQEAAEEIPSTEKPSLEPPGPAIPLPALAPQPSYVVSSEGYWRESLFSLLAYLQTHPIRLQNQQLAAKDQEALANCLPPPLLSTSETAAEIEFWLHLGQRAGLLIEKYGRLRPEREATRSWLLASEGEQCQLLQNTWRADPTWNDLWHTPGLAPRPTGWENSPLLARSKILGYLRQVMTHIPPGQWLPVDDFIATIKRFDPDFQRPGGDYQSWYIYDPEGRPLMGFEHWDAVEGALIRYVVSHILLLLGVVDVGLTSQTGQPVSFKITPQGQAFLSNSPLPQETRRALFLRVGPNFQVDAPARASLYDRFQLTRFAALERREENRAIYKISQASVGRALRNGVTADQMVAFLARASNNQTPLKVVETLRAWGRRQGTARLERVTLLRLEGENLVEEVRRHPALRSLLGEIIGPATILVPADNAREVRRLLIELGYLIEGDPQ